MDNFLEELLQANVAAAVTILVLLFARNVVRKIAGGHSAYVMWMIVPATMASALLPRIGAPIAVEPEMAAISSASPVVTEGMRMVAQTMDGSRLASGALPLVWLVGTIAMLAWQTQRQVLFLRDVKRGLAGPAVMGFLRPRIVTPGDFSTRFEDNERELILAHEQIHLSRGDALVNAAVAMLRCICWFNPMIHAGARAMRIDQELSCDAAVLERRPRERRAYAETLLKSQLATRPLPLGCYWPSGRQHPLEIRIEMLGRSPASWGRRLVAAGVIAAVGAGGCLSAWGLQKEEHRLMVARQPTVKRDTRLHVEAVNPVLDAELSQNGQFQVEGALAEKTAETTASLSDIGSSITNARDVETRPAPPEPEQVATVQQQQTGPLQQQTSPAQRVTHSYADLTKDQLEEQLRILEPVIQSFDAYHDNSARAERAAKLAPQGPSRVHELREQLVEMRARKATPEEMKPIQDEYFARLDAQPLYQGDDPDAFKAKRKQQLMDIASEIRAELRRRG